MSVEMEKTQQLEQVAAPVTAPRLPRVNLLPPEIAAESAFKKTQFILAGAAAAVVLTLGAGFAISAMQASNAADDLAAQQKVASDLSKEEAQYARVPEVLGKIANVENAQATGMATDVAWYSQLDAINAKFPEGMTFESLKMTMNDGMTAAATAEATPNPLAEPGAIGTITIEALNTTYSGSADWLDMAGSQPGYVNQYYTMADAAWDADSKTNLVKLSTTVEFTDEVLTHRFDRKAN